MWLSSYFFILGVTELLSGVLSVQVVIITSLASMVVAGSQWRSCMCSLALGLLCSSAHWLTGEMMKQWFQSHHEASMVINPIGMASFQGLPWSVEIPWRGLKQGQTCRLSWQGFQDYQLNNGLSQRAVQMKTGSLGYLNGVKVKHCYDKWEHWRAQVRQVLKPFKHKDMMLALWLGDLSSINNKKYRLFLNSGLLPTMVISGAHLGLLALGLRRLLKYCVPASVHQPLLIDLCVVSLALVYVLFTGFGLAAYRAWCMLMCYPLMRFLKVPLTGEAIFHWSMRSAILLQPQLIFQSSFVISAMYVATLIHLMPMIRSKWLSELVMWLVSVPLHLAFFGQINWLSWFFCGALSSIIMSCFGLLTLMMILYALGLGMVGFWIGNIIDVLLSWVLCVLHDGEILMWVSSVHWSYEWVFTIMWLQWLLCSYGGLGICCLVCVVLSGYLIYVNNIALSEAKVTVFDVGHGLSVLVETKHHVLMYDTASSHYRRELQVVWKPMITQLDRLVLSHGDHDHSGNASWVRWHYQPDVWHGDGVAGGYAASRGDGWIWDNVRFDVKSPGMADLSGNDGSLVLKVTTLHEVLWIMGDVGYKVEQSLVSDEDCIKGAHLVVSHHGSASGSSSAWLQCIKPKFSYISVGKQYKLPHPLIVKRLKQWGAVRTTKEDGKMVFTMH